MPRRSSRPTRQELANGWSDRRLMAPVTRYTRSGEASIAYQVAGDGVLDLLFMTGWISQVEQLWESPALRRLLERLSVFSRLILFDRRGTGLSDSVGESYTLEQEARDALAVLDAVGSERAALFTYGLGGPVGVQLAADRPERIGALIMYASIARTSWAPDYDWAMTVEDRAQWTERTVATWGETVEAARMGWGLCTVAGVAGKGETLDIVPRMLITGRRVCGSSFGGVKGRDQVPQLVDRYLRGDIDVDPFISHRMSLGEVNRAFELMESQDGIRSVLEFDR
jgi:pimeloyl-ACP methyl ester carboxylesterase